MTQTPATKLASLVLGEDLEAWVVARRQAGQTWVEISQALAEATDGQVRLSYETLRTHYRDSPLPDQEAQAS